MIKNSIRHPLYKIELLFLKIMPMLLTIIVILKRTLDYFDWNPQLLSYIGGASLIPLAFIYLSSYVFKFCWFHKMFLVYVTADLLFNIIDFFVCFPQSTIKYYCLSMIAIGITLFIILLYKRTSGFSCLLVIIQCQKKKQTCNNHINQKHILV